MSMRCTGEKCPLKGLLEELQGGIESCTAHNCPNRTVPEKDDEPPNLINSWCEKKIDSPDPNTMRDCEHFWQKTNADRIRTMAASDERIAGCLLALDIHLAEDGNEFTELYCHGDNNCIDENDDITCNDEMRKTCILRWLQQPAEEVL